MKNFPQTLYAAVSACYWMLYAITAGFSSVYLQPRGYTNAQIGYILCAGFLLGALLQVVVARAADTSRRYPPAAFLLGTIVAYTAAMVAVGLFPRAGMGLTGAYIAQLAAVMVAQPLCNSLAFYLERCGCRINFGIARGVGSLGYALMSAVMGLILGRYATDALRYGAYLVVAVIVVLLYVLCRRYPLSAAAAKEETVQGSTGRGLLARYPGFRWLLAGTVGLFIGHALVNNFLFQVVQNVGGNETDLGAINAYMAALEIPVMLSFSLLARRIEVRKLLVLSGIFFIFKTGGIMLSGSVAMLYLVLLTQALSFAVFQTGSVYYIGHRMERSDENRGQAYATAMISAGNIIASLCGGYLIDNWGVSGTLLAGTAVSALGAACIIMLYFKTKEAE